MRFLSSFENPFSMTVANPTPGNVLSTITEAISVRCWSLGHYSS